MGAASAAPQCVGGKEDVRRGKESPSCRGRLSHPTPAKICLCSHSKPWELGGAGGDWGAPADTEDQHKRNVAPASKRDRHPRSPELPQPITACMASRGWGYRDMGCRVVPGACASSPARQPQGGSPHQCWGAGALSISPSAWEHTGWGKPTPIMFVPLI